MQPIFLAGKTFLDEIAASRQSGGEDPLQAVLIMIARQNLEILVNGLRKMEHRWAEAGFPLSVRSNPEALI